MIYCTTPTPKAQGSLWKWEGKIVRSKRNRKFTHTHETSPTCLIKTPIRMIPIHMLTWKQKAQEASGLDKELKVTKERLDGEIVFSREEYISW